MVDIACANPGTLLPTIQPDISPPRHATQYWFSPFSITRSEKDALIRKLRERPHSKTAHNPRYDHEFKPQPPQNRKPRQSSKPLVPRDSVSPERARHLERNRIAANKCRLKKKREHEQIQHVLDNETAKHDTLLAEVDFLKEEIWHLKNRIFEHAKCDDQQINLQLTKMTQSVLDGPGSGPGSGPGAGQSSPLTCVSPAFSISTWSDGSVLDAGGNGGLSIAGANPAISTDGAVYEGYPEGVMFDSFVDVPNV